MGARAPQLSIVGLKTPEEIAAEETEMQMRRERRGVLRARLMAALREFARERQMNTCATELDKDDALFGGGKGVAASTLRACLEGVERNYFRLDWILWFAEESEDVADLLCQIAGRGKAEKTPEEELEDLKAQLRAEFPRQADKLIRKARAPR